MSSAGILCLGKLALQRLRKAKQKCAEVLKAETKAFPPNWSFLSVPQKKGCASRFAEGAKMLMKCQLAAFSRAFWAPRHHLAFFPTHLFIYILN